MDISVRQLLVSFFLFNFLQNLFIVKFLPFLYYLLLEFLNSINSATSFIILLFIYLLDFYPFYFPKYCFNVMRYLYFNSTYVQRKNSLCSTHKA